MQQLSRLRIDGGGTAKEPVGIIVPHDPRQLGRGVVQFAVTDQIGLAARHQLLLQIVKNWPRSELITARDGAELLHADIACVPCDRELDCAPGPHRNSDSGRRPQQVQMGRVNRPTTTCDSASRYRFARA